MLCAMINNNATCYDECEDFADRLEDLLEEPFKVRMAAVLTLRLAACSLD